MADDSDDAASGRMVSPTLVGAKHDRSDDEEEELTRRATRRHDFESELSSSEESSVSMEHLILEDLRSGDEEFLEETLYKLRELVRDDGSDVERTKKQKGLFMLLGGHNAVVRVMNEHPDYEGIQQNGIRVISSVVYKNQDLKTAVAKVQGLQAILAAMAEFPRRKQIQFNAMLALTNLTWIGGKRKTHIGNAKILATDLNGIPAILTAMKEFSDDVKVIRLSCRVLSHICLVDELRDAFFDTDALTALAKARDNFKDNKKIGEAAARVFAAYVEYQRVA